MSSEDGNEILGSFYFKPDGVNEVELNIKYKPGFLDALQLICEKDSKQYRKVPLMKNTSLIFQYTDGNSKKLIRYKIDLEKNTIQIKDGEKDAGNRHFSCFLIGDGKRISYMVNKPNTKDKTASINKPHSLDGHEEL